MDILFYVTLLCILWASAAVHLILGSLERMGIGPRFIWRRFVIPDYVRQYKMVTQQRQGRPGPLFYHFVIPIRVGILLAILLGFMVRG